MKTIDNDKLKYGWKCTRQTVNIKPIFFFFFFGDKNEMSELNNNYYLWLRLLSAKSVSKFKKEKKRKKPRTTNWQTIINKIQMQMISIFSLWKCFEKFFSFTCRREITIFQLEIMNNNNGFVFFVITIHQKWETKILSFFKPTQKTLNHRYGNWIRSFQCMVCIVIYNLFSFIFVHTMGQCPVLEKNYYRRE